MYHPSKERQIGSAVVPIPLHPFAFCLFHLSSIFSTTAISQQTIPSLLLSHHPFTPTSPFFIHRHLMMTPHCPPKAKKANCRRRQRKSRHSLPFHSPFTQGNIPLLFFVLSNPARPIFRHSHPSPFPSSQIHLQSANSLQSALPPDEPIMSPNEGGGGEVLRVLLLLLFDSP